MLSTTSSKAIKLNSDCLDNSNKSFAKSSAFDWRMEPTKQTSDEQSWKSHTNRHESHKSMIVFKRWNFFETWVTDSDSDSVFLVLFHTSIKSCSILNIFYNYQLKLCISVDYTPLVWSFDPFLSFSNICTDSPTNNILSATLLGM